MLVKSKLFRDAAGSVFVEATVMLTLLFVFVLGAIDFLFAFYQYNSAAKAVAMGARIAAVWDPVATGLNDLSTNAVTSGGITAGTQMPAFTVVCDGSVQTCTCTGYCTGIVNGTTSFNLSAMKAIVLGRGNDGTNCNTGGPIYRTGMCGFFGGIGTQIGVQNVRVTYTQPAPSSGTAPWTGLGYAGRPGGPVPTLSLSLQNVPVRMFFLSHFPGFSNFTLPPITTTITGEVLSSSAP